ncbi:MAG: GIY-YIG nuclease family protein [Bacteroidetes bacterium]|uniref:GIY-YIG nuclease family protein n=1 Tax=Candidatus Cryptobacteroides faecigallinarum TaxID=2840763 RepID=A0A9D9NHF4_9BACT|nr:GIY-YIG nuclease family protein [Candidatus Cryptobacteroides faecigallinarum]
MYYVYILTTRKNTAMYIGVTNNLQRRIFEHKSGQIAGYTQKYCCHKLVYYETFSDIEQAIEREKILKGWKREKKNMLVESTNPTYEELVIDE